MPRRRSAHRRRSPATSAMRSARASRRKSPTSPRKSLQPRKSNAHRVAFNEEGRTPRVAALFPFSLAAHLRLRRQRPTSLRPLGELSPPPFPLPLFGCPVFGAGGLGGSGGVGASGGAGVERATPVFAFSLNAVLRQPEPGTRNRPER